MQKERAAVRRHNADRFWLQSNVPERHRRALDAWAAGRSKPGEPEWVVTREILRSRLGVGVLIALLGGRGLGKTQLAVDAVRAACQRGLAAYYVTALDVFRELNASFGSESTKELAIVARFVQYNLLVIDELGVRRFTPAEAVSLTDLIDKRYGRMRDTILISNETVEAFTDSVGLSVCDRLIESGGLIECTWPSFRGKTIAT